jgi:phage head maturation protease
MSFGFFVSDERWENLESDYPTRYINKFKLIKEISAVTFPAYDATEIMARSKDALDSARADLERSRQQSVKGVDTSEIELLKAKLIFKTKI